MEEVLICCSVKGIEPEKLAVLDFGALIERLIRIFESLI
jgi:hypothetical protein